MLDNSHKYSVDKRKYVIRFVFQSKHDALNFRLPSEYRKNYDLNKNLNTDDGQFARIAQVKLSQ